MSEDENIEHLPNPPEKLANRISQQSEDLKDRETLVGNGELKLTSEHPVSVVDYSLAVHVDDWADWTYKDYSYDLTRFLECCEYAEHDDLSECHRVTYRDSSSGESETTTSDWQRYTAS